MTATAEIAANGRDGFQSFQKSLALMRAPQEVEYRKPVGVGDDRLAVDQAGARWQLGERQRDERKPIGQIVARPAEQPHARATRRTPSSPGTQDKAFLQGQIAKLVPG